MRIRGKERVLEADDSKIPKIIAKIGNELTDIEKAEVEAILLNWGVVHPLSVNNYYSSTRDRLKAAVKFIEDDPETTLDDALA